MDCQHAQELWNDATGPVSADAQAELHRHLAECSDCRVLRQREHRLQQLLALKRYERPPRAYYDNFLADFHRRLDAEDQQPRWWQQVFELPAWRYGLTATAAASLCLAAVMYWPKPSRQGAGKLVVQKPVTLLATAEVFAATSDLVPPSAGGVVLVPAASATPSAPGYVLDRIKITPASYETSSVRF